MLKYSIFHIEGGLGKHIAATAVAKCIKTNHPDRKLIIVSGWPQVFVGLDFVDRVYRHNNTPYFYEEYIKDKDSIIFRQIGTNKWKRDKPVLLIHTNGGPIQGQKHDYAWTRDLPGKNIAEVANHYMHEGYHIIQVCRKKEQCIEGMEHVYESMNNLEFFQLLQHSDKRLLIDSCLQHAAYAMKLPSTVCWKNYH